MGETDHVTGGHGREEVVPRDATATSSMESKPSRQHGEQASTQKGDFRGSGVYTSFYITD